MAFLKVCTIALLVAAASGRPQSANPANVAAYERAIANGEMFDPNPQYNYEFQVADDDEQTYIAQTESRDGDNVNGEYSYVDADGSLVTVTYTAGIDGYNEERNVQQNFVTIRAKPARKQVTSTTATTSNFGQQRVVVPAAKKVTTTTSSSSSLSDEDLINRIVSQLTPFIRQTVSSSLSGSTTTRRVVQQPITTTRRVVQPVAQAVTTTTVERTQSKPATVTEGVFGVSGQNNIRFTAPDFNYAFELL